MKLKSVSPFRFIRRNISALIRNCGTLQLKRTKSPTTISQMRANTMQDDRKIRFSVNNEKQQHCASAERRESFLTNAMHHGHRCPRPGAAKAAGVQKRSRPSQPAERGPAPRRPPPAEAAPEGPTARTGASPTPPNDTAPYRSLSLNST